MSSLVVAYGYPYLKEQGTRQMDLIAESPELWWWGCAAGRFRRSRSSADGPFLGTGGRARLCWHALLRVWLVARALTVV
eukprot:scaffold395_cov383-Prasinococcus_capsulatus_cf.AAC.12